MATTATGNVFVWGWNAFGQLGLVSHGRFSLDNFLTGLELSS
jgi:alpha-tubulin suppressor-like RCC1 family protein